MSEESLISIMRDGMKVLAVEEKERLLLCAHIKTALSTQSGRILKAWLKTACFMNDVMNEETVASVAKTQRVEARRDLYVALAALEEEGSRYVTDK